MAEARRHGREQNWQEANDLASMADASARLLADQVAAMTVVTAMGFNLAAQMTGAFMGAMLRRFDAVEARVPAKKNVVPLHVVTTPDAERLDDLKKISGIGPKLEKALREMGCRTFADIAGWSDADVKRIDAELGLAGRISRDDWVGQAKALARGAA